MSEYATRGHGYESSYAPRSSIVETYVAPQRTQAEIADDAITSIDRDVADVARALDSLVTLTQQNDPKGWHEARGALDRKIANAAGALERTLAQTHEATPEARQRLSIVERELARHRADASEHREPPSGWKPVSREDEVRRVLAAPVVGGAHLGFARKEAELKAELARLSPVESRILAERIRKAWPGDPIAAELALMLPIRRERILAVLDDARRREAVQIGRDAAAARKRSVATPASEPPITNNPVDLAARAVEGVGQPMPFRDRIQASFGRHDISGLRAHVGGIASGTVVRLGARAFAFGDRVAFATAPDLHTAAHEAAHHVQQRAGVALAGGVGQVDDEYEQHADRVADAVVKGVSAERLLDRMPRRGGTTSAAVQYKTTIAPSSSTATLDWSYQITGGGMSARIQRSWLQEQPVEHWTELLTAMQSAGAVPWAKPEALARFARKLAASYALRDELVSFHLDMIAIAIIGLPPDAAPKLERIGNDILVAVPGVYSDGASEQIALDADRLDAVYRALSSFTGLRVSDHVGLAVIGASSATGIMRLHDADLAQIFGEPAWSTWKKHSTHAASSSGRPAHTDRKDSSALSVAETARITKWFGAHGTVPHSFSSRAVLAMLDELERDPALAGAVEHYLLRGRQSGGEHPLDELTLRDAIDRARLERERARLGLPAFQANAVEMDPAGTFDLPARLVEHGLLLAGRTAHFDLVLDWSGVGAIGQQQYDAIANRKWHAVVEWVFERTDVQGPANVDGRPLAAAERIRTEHGSSSDIGIDRTFRLEPHVSSGIWTVHAFLHTSQFAPKHLVTTVEVKTEAARMADLRGEAFAGMAPARATSEAHHFDIGDRNRAVESVRDAASGNAPHDGPSGDSEGTSTTGALPNDFHARTAEERAQVRQAELARMEQLVAYLQAQPRRDNAAAIAAATRRLDHLREANTAILGDERDGWQSFELRGTYLSRTPEAPSGPLDLYGSVRHFKHGPARYFDGAFDHVEVQIRDNTQRFSAENFVFEGRDTTFEAALERAFVTMCKDYPEGKMSILAQGMEAAGATPTATGRAIGFELATTSPWKRLKDKLYNPVTQALINAAATAVMIFQPELAPALMWILAIDNTVASVDQLVTMRDNGTLTGKREALSLAQIGLDFLPLARGARVLQSEGALFAFEAVNYAGMALVLTLETKEAIAQLQEGDIAALADKYRALLELEKSTNASDPQLAVKRAEIDRGAEQIRQRTIEEWTKALAQNGAFLVGTHVLAHLQRGIAGDAPTRTGSGLDGSAIAARVHGVTYESGGTFRVVAGDRAVEVRISRTGGKARVRVDGDHAVIEIPRGLAGPELERATTEQLGEVSRELQPHRASGDQVTQEMAPGSFEVTASAVAGSSFKGKSDAHTDPAELLAHANHALEAVAADNHDVAGVDRAHVDLQARLDERTIAENTRVLRLADGTRITIRVSVAPLDGQTVARSVLNPTKQGVTAVDTSAHGVEVEQIDGRYVIQLSDKMDPAHVQRAVAHEVAEILARRELFLENKVPGRDVLRAGSDAAGPLSPHDRGRVAEIEELARAARSGKPAVAESARHELMALVEDMGLRDGVDGAKARFERVEGELSDAARAELAHARASESELSEVDAEKLGRMREQAALDRKAQAEFERAHAPLHERPSTGLGRKATASERAALAQKAHVLREARSVATLAHARQAEAAGKRLKLRVQLGGNAALAARDPNALLIDANQRWAIDASARIAQTAQQMEAVRAAGIGDPYEFADANERVPIEAVRYWQDSIAAQGPVIDGIAELGVDDHGTLIATIQPSDGSAPVIVEVEGVPVVATGFTHENAPGARRLSPRQALMAIDRGLASLANDPAVGAAATSARAALAKLHGVNEEDAAKAVAALPPDVRAKLVTIEDPKLGEPVRNAVTVVEAQASWAELRAAEPGRVLFGDEANKLTDAQVQRMGRVVIAGSGGTGISAAEIILRKSKTAHVTMIGKDAPAGLTENDQFRSVVATYGSAELCKRFHIKPEPDGAPGRFEFHDGYMLGAPTHDAGVYDANARPVVAEGVALPPSAFQGDTYISAMGRFDDLPPPIAALANQAERNGGTVSIEVIPSEDGFFVGYRTVIRQPGRSDITIDVTGAASRFAEKPKLTRDEQTQVDAAQDHDAPSEGGNFPGGYAPSATQAARYRSERISRGY